MATIKVLGKTDETTDCEKCGKRNLKLTVVLDIEGEIVRYGSDCADRAINGGKGSASGAKRVAKQAAALDTARELLDSGTAIKDAAAILWNRFGFPVDARPDGIRFDFGTTAA